MRWGYVERNVAEMADVPRIVKKEITPLSPEQIVRLLDGCRNNRDRAFYAIATMAGLRRGELLALKWGDVDLTARVLRVRRALSVTRDGLIFVPPKTQKSRRSVDLTLLTTEALAKHKGTSRLIIGAEDLIFPNLQGGPKRPSTMSQHFERLAARLGLPGKVRLHDLRHTAATMMFLKEVHPKVVQEILGHSTISITLDLYTHFIPSLQREAVQALDDLLTTNPNEDEQGPVAA